MKKLVLLLAAFALIGCGEKKESGVGAADNDEGAVESVTAETEAPASPESKIIGYWALDFEKCRKAFEDLPDSEEKEEFSKFLSVESEEGLFVHFSKGGKFGMYKYDEGPEFSTFTIITDDEGVISIDTEEAVSLELKGDTLQMIPPRSGPREPEGSPSEWAIMGCFRLSRIDAAEAKRRMERVLFPSDDSEEATELAEPSADTTGNNDNNPLSNALKGKTFGKFIILDEVQTDYGDRSLAKKNAENTLGKYPEVDAMVGLWAYNAPQCLEALKDANKLGEVKVFSFDEDPVTLAAIKEGHCEGTVVQDPYNFGYQSMRHLKEIVVDEKMPELNEGKYIAVPTHTIVKDNVAEFRKTVEDRLAAGEAAKGAEAPADAPKFAFITNVADPFWSHAEAGCYVAAKEFGVAVEFQMNSAGDIAGQKKIVENILNKGDCKGIAISVLNPANQTEMINNAADQLPLITYDSDAPDSTRLFFLGTENYQAGRELGKLLKKSMPEGGKIMLYVGKIDQLNSIQRRDGLLDELAGKPAK